MYMLKMNWQHHGNKNRQKRQTKVHKTHHSKNKDFSNTNPTKKKKKNGLTKSLLKILGRAEHKDINKRKYEQSN